MIKLLFPVFFSLFAIFSCEKENDITTEEPPLNSSINKIMPLGASRVEGGRPEFESYRYELWKELVAGGWTFDFIGTMNDEASYPEYNNTVFDVDHEGRGGWTSGEILGGINSWLEQAGSPDIVLFSSPGGNDALQGLPYADALSNVNAIIDALQSANPKVTIIIEQLAPARSDAMTPELSTFFAQLQEDVVSIAASQTTASSQVLLVDIASGFSDALFADDVHYNEAGARFVADRYYDVLVNLLEQ